MALTAFQTRVVRLLAARRKSSGESYVAGGVALNQALRAPRISRDVDLFHDSATALRQSWDDDCRLLREAGMTVHTLRDTAHFVEAAVRAGPEQVLLQWARDSAFRFFPLIEDELLGLTLHPLDLATNKALAMAGRLEPRDWVDMISCHERLQPLGYLAWAACGKDPGYNPDLILASAARARYAQAELNDLDFAGSTPSAALLSRVWKRAVSEAQSLCAAMPAEQVGQCVLLPNCQPYQGTVEQLTNDLQAGTVYFHAGHIGGVWPNLSANAGSPAS